MASINQNRDHKEIVEHLIEERDRLLQLSIRVKDGVREERKTYGNEVSDSDDGGIGKITAQGSDIDIAVGHMLDGRFDRISYALQKVESGSYGTCESCDKQIPSERLKVMPEATLCLECQELEERKGYAREWHHDEID